MKIGDKLFNFKLQATNGNWYSNFTFADKYALLIIVTCNHCPYSQAYWNRIFKLFSKYNEDDLAIIALNPNDTSRYPQDSMDNMRKLLQQMNQENFIYLFDESQEIAKQLGATKTPEAFLFNWRRELVYIGAIDDCWENEKMVSRVYLEDALEYCLDGLEIDYPEIPAVGCSIKWKPGNEPNSATNP